MEASILSHGAGLRPSKKGLDFSMSTSELASHACSGGIKIKPSVRRRNELVSSGAKPLNPMPIRAPLGE